MTPADALRGLPDDARVSVTVGSGDLRVADLRRAFGAVDPHRVLTTGEASQLLGYSADTWREWAPRIPGAYRDPGERAYWRLPYAACVEHLRRLRAERLNRGRRGRPWKQRALAEQEAGHVISIEAKRAAAAQARDAGAAGVPARPVDGGGPAAVGRRASDDAGSESSGMA